jgi:hypothetical protein
MQRENIATPLLFMCDDAILLILPFAGTLVGQDQVWYAAHIVVNVTYPFHPLLLKALFRRSYQSAIFIIRDFLPRGKVYAAKDYLEKWRADIRIRVVVVRVRIREPEA